MLGSSVDDLPDLEQYKFNSTVVMPTTTPITQIPALTKSFGNVTDEGATDDTLSRLQAPRMVVW